MLPCGKLVGENKAACPETHRSHDQAWSCTYSIAEVPNGVKWKRRSLRMHNNGMLIQPQTSTGKAVVVCGLALWAKAGTDLRGARWL
jgi:hypothetical protein